MTREYPAAYEVSLRSFDSIISSSLGSDVSIHTVAQQIRDFTFAVMFCFDVRNDLEIASRVSCQKRIVHFPCSNGRVHLYTYTRACTRVRACVRNTRRRVSFAIPTQSLTYKGQLGMHGNSCTLLHATAVRCMAFQSTCAINTMKICALCVLDPYYPNLISEMPFKSAVSIHPRHRDTNRVANCFDREKPTSSYRSSTSIVDNTE